MAKPKEKVIFEQETWENATKGTVMVLKYNRHGDLEHETVRSGGKVSISTEERLMNQERAYDENLDDFHNGRLVPVRLLDDAEDAAEIAANPNLKSDEDLTAMFKLHWKSFESEVAEIRNPFAINRLMELSANVDATQRQVDVLKTRLQVLDPASAAEREVVSVAPVTADTTSASAFRAVSPT